MRKVGGPKEDAAVQSDIRTGKGWIMGALIGWALFLLPFALLLIRNGGAAIEIYNDDAMRLVEVRDLIAGRGWFDHIEPRLGLGEGTWIHWSRLVDAPIAGLILLFTPLLGQPGAETVALVAWPLLVAFVPIAAVAFTASNLSSPLGAVLGAILMAQMLVITTEFAPGSLDHHNVQIALLVTAVCLAIVGLSRPGFAAGAGAAVAATVAVGIETLPHVTALSAFLAALWAARGEAVRRPVLLFCIGLAVTLVALFAVAAPPEAYRGGFCDSLSIDQAAPILIGTLGLALSARLLSSQGAAVRVLALVVIGAGALAEAWLVTPACLSNPVGQLDPFLKEVWFDQVNEVQPLFTAIRIVPANLIPVVAVWCIAAIATTALIVRGRNRSEWIIVALMLLAAMGMTLWQMRGALFVGALSVLPIICVVELLYGYGQKHGRFAIRMGALLLFFVSVPHFWAFVALNFATASKGVQTGTAFTGNLERCYEPRQYQALAALPPGLVAAGSNIGAFILLNTPHRVLSAPYHRDQAGMVAQFRIDFATDEAAERMLRELGVDYVVTCSENVEFVVSDGSEPGFSFRLKDGKHPDFLLPEPTDLDDPVISVYRLAPAP
jgi:hypothetical protein